MWRLKQPSLMACILYRTMEKQMNQVLVISVAAACVGFILVKCLSESTIVVVDFISDLMQQQPVFDCTPESSGTLYYTSDSVMTH